jgi:hypothetical protein
MSKLGSEGRRDLLSAREFKVGLLRRREDAIRVRDALRVEGRNPAARRMEAHIKRLDELIEKSGGSVVT